MKALKVLGSEVSTDKNHLLSLTDLYRVSGVDDNSKKPKAWLRLKRTKNLIQEVEKEYLRVDFSPLKTAGKAGTFACEELITAYAMHISPTFELVVIKAFLADAKKKLKKAELHGKAEWQQNRELGKLQRRDITDTIQAFIDYAKAQGSRSAQRYFINITKCVNTALGISDRDEIDEAQLHLLTTAEHIAERTLLEGMSERLPYKVIFQNLKREVFEFGVTVGTQVAV